MFQTNQVLRGLWGLAPSNLSILRKIDTSKSQWSPVVWCCSRNRVFVTWFENLHFCGKNYNSYTAIRSNAGGVACKLGLQASAIRKASLHADHPPMCLKMLCKCTIIQYCNASLCKKLRHYFRHYFVWHLLVSNFIMWICLKESFSLTYVFLY